MSYCNVREILTGKGRCLEASFVREGIMSDSGLNVAASYARSSRKYLSVRVRFLIITLCQASYRCAGIMAASPNTQAVIKYKPVMYFYFHFLIND